MFPSGVFRLPIYIANYFNDQANISAKSLASMSSRQQRVIQESILKNVDEFQKSEIFRAIQYDVYHSGKDAFTVTEKGEE